MSDTEAVEERIVFNVLNHDLVPMHEVVEPEVKQEIIDRYGMKKEDQFPKILASDPAAKACGAKPGDVVKVTRISPTAGRAVAYRLCVEFA